MSDADALWQEAYRVRAYRRPINGKADMPPTPETTKAPQGAFLLPDIK
jgi:hypothetical protein